MSRDVTLGQRIVQMLATRPAGLMTDIDGTISRIVPRPEEAIVEPKAREALDRLANQLAVVAAVSGRGAVDAARIVGAEGLVYVGNHGLERASTKGIVINESAKPYVSDIASVLDEVENLTDVPGLIFENKGVTGSIHFRNAADPEEASSLILTTLKPIAERRGLRISAGRMVIEVRPPIRRNKGTALTEIVADYGLRSVVFLGDDVTDLDAMKALRDLRDAGEVDGLNIGVVGAESPEQIRQQADVTLEGVDGVIDLLQFLAASLERRGSEG